MRKIMVGNGKGGVGKTASSVSLAHALATLGNSVLLVDADPQGNTSTWLSPSDVSFELAEILGEDINSSICSLKQGFDLICTYSNGSLREMAKTTLLNKPYLIKQTFEKIIRDYDFIIFDTSPSFTPLERAVCLTCDEVIVPVELEFFAVEGLAEFDNQVKTLNRDMYGNTEINKVILTKINKSYSRHNIFNDSIKTNSSLTFYDVRQDAALADCMALHKTIFEYDNKAKSANDYMNIAQELLNEKGR